MRPFCQVFQNLFLFVRILELFFHYYVEYCLLVTRYQWGSFFYKHFEYFSELFLNCHLQSMHLAYLNIHLHPYITTLDTWPIRKSAMSYYSFLAVKTNSKGCLPSLLYKSGLAPLAIKCLTSPICPLCIAAINGVTPSTYHFCYLFRNWD